MRFLAVALLWALALPAVAQIGVSDTVITSIDSSAMLDVQGTKRGTLLSRMTTAQRLAIPNPAEGLLVYDLTKHKFYAFTNAGWRALQFEDNAVAPQVLLNPTSGNGEFGHSVSVFGDYIAVGAPRETVGGKSQQGSVTIFEKTESGFTYLTTINSPDGQAGDLFGYSLQIGDTTLLIGSVLDDVGENINQGSVYVYGRTNNSWAFRYKLYGSNGAAGDEFGNTLHMRGNQLLIGAHFDDYATSSNQGSTYYFQLQNNTWVERQKIFADDGNTGDQFGSDVFLSDGVMAVSSYTDDSQSAIDVGSVYIFRYDAEIGAWQQVSKAYPNDGNSYDLFGFSIVISGNYLVVGSPYQDYPFNSKDRGAAYFL